MLLAALAELAAIVPLVAFSLVPVWALAPAVLAVVWAFFWVRSAVRAEQALARARRRRPTRALSSETQRGAGAGERVLAAPAEAADVAVVSGVEGPEHEAGERRPASPDVAPAAEVMVPIVDEDDIPLTWDPVPVPRPTYTMKAKAERAEVAPAAVTPDPAPVVPRSRVVLNPLESVRAPAPSRPVSSLGLRWFWTVTPVTSTGKGKRTS